MSDDAKDLINRILNTDPEKRYNIEEIRAHPWFNLVKCNNNAKGTIPGIDPTPIDPSLLVDMKGYNIDIDYAKKCLEANKHNHFTSTYYLLLKKHLKGGGESIADVGSPKYDPSIFLKRTPNVKDLTANKTEAKSKQTPNKENKRMASQQPADRIRRIADGLVDMDRYPDYRKRNQHRRTESTGAAAAKAAQLAILAEDPEMLMSNFQGPMNHSPVNFYPN